MTKRSFYDLLDTVPAHIPNASTAEEATQNLRHVLAVYTSPEGGGPLDPNRLVIEATSGYTARPTGLTWGDLMLINDALARLEGLDK